MAINLNLSKNTLLFSLSQWIVSSWEGLESKHALDFEIKQFLE